MRNKNFFFYGSGIFCYIYGEHLWTIRSNIHLTWSKPQGEIIRSRLLGRVKIFLASISYSVFLVGVCAFTVSLSNKWLTFCTAAQACPKRWSQTKERELEVHWGISAKTYQNAWIVTPAVGRRPARGLSRVYKARRSTPTCRHSSSVPCNTWNDAFVSLHYPCEHKPSFGLLCGYIWSV